MSDLLEYEITDYDDLIAWEGLARAEIATLRAERDAAIARAEAAEAKLADVPSRPTLTDRLRASKPGRAAGEFPKAVPVEPIKTYFAAAERLSRVTPGQQIRHFRVKGTEPTAVVHDVRYGAGGDVLSFSIVATNGATSSRAVHVWAAEGWDVMR